ncbi:efflux RND transporter periplasmic adaptor subunit [Aquimarina sp. AD1]|uniref:efflux RND transporter periplasmic adaptor subunit n=1 Tax=Aquimarina sp. (strain AD1) TaxID=1714848 RepID=UPI000E46A43D|nr:efflux RND transporter periplasmic adaptor subunit [Aquimarina sp. AD1]AXT58101.1 efflux RND transporter periplasmic adaptor subunit [Aquimarina sp. AD1]RKN37255.1 efflux RND transporter periplasmic adaptor subunit [Aquimarina sp. AD1]
MKKYVSIIIGVSIVILGVLAFNLLNVEDNKKKEEVTAETPIKVIKVKRVKLTNVPYAVEATGILHAKEKIELYSEVQGVIQKTNTAFKIGNRFRKGQALIVMDNKEHTAQIKSARSDLMNQIAAMLPDMEIDYPNISKKWETYLENLTVNSKTPELPEFNSNEEKLFVSGKNIYSAYYNIINLEERLSKYYINAPFTGIVTESNVNVGTLIRSGQKIGEFTDDSNFELHLSIPASDNRYLKKGISVHLKTMDNFQSFSGKITRINGKINQDTQSVNVIVEVSNEGLKDGLYLKAQIDGDDLIDVFKIDNALILENNMVYVVKDNLLELKPIRIVNYQGNASVITGLESENIIVNQSIANAYPGMPVEILE